MMDAKAGREEGIERVLADEYTWYDVAIMKLHKFPKGERYTGEQIRHELLRRGLWTPHHHNAWGGFMMHAVRQEIIIKTGELVPMADKKSHARMTPIYEKT